MVGTIDYISPEVVEGKSASYESDLWALGVMVYVMFTGKKPFRSAEGDAKTFESISQGMYK